MACQAEPTIIVRALTRKPMSFRAKELVRAGATVVEADFGNITSLYNAFEGCYGAFGLTDYYEAFEEERQHGINIVDAAKATKLKHLVMSTVSPLVDSLKDTPVCAYKYQIHTYLAKSGVPYTAFTPSFYYSNIFLFDILTKGANGNWVMNFPFPSDIPIPCVSPEDIGAYALAVFASPSEWIGENIWLCNELISLRECVETFAEVTGFTVKVYDECTREDFLALKDEPYVLGIWPVFKFFIDNHDQNYSYASPALAQRLYPKKQTWKDFLTKYREVPIPQPVAIECYHTRERFGDP
ncbi:unnamed protein product [Rhizoctonia solani]|uniref:NmrA-like domain-containing protein n=1 Tax=Rhizoctonia solani TaxID=456999 RepID=A0A8H3A2B6_9AGAM|nr:unnamed protein product [Rhizoctonia solani]